MASKPEILEVVIRPMTAICRPLCDPTNDPSGYARAVDQYVESLEEFSLAVLRQGMNLWRLDWTSGIWPVPGMLRKYMAEAQREITPRITAPERLPPPKHIPSEERNRVGDQLVHWRKLLESGRFWDMTHKQAYNAVYGDSMSAEHKARFLEGPL